MINRSRFPSALNSLPKHQAQICTSSRPLTPSPEAFPLATADLEMPTSGVVEAARAEFDGISLRMITGYNITTDQLVTRMDILYGYAAIRPEWACVVADVL